MLVPILVCAALSFSCVSFSPARREGQNAVAAKELAFPSVLIADAGIKTASALEAFFIAEVPDADVLKVRRLAALYIIEASFEGINSDIAFAQMCLETGFLRFGGLITEDMHNFCGLGAIDENNRGCRFNSEQEGVRAHIQHLKAYGSTEELRMPLADPRYRWVQPKGKAPDVYALSGTWASDRQYGEKLAGILKRMARF